MLTIITLASTTATDILAYVGNLFDDLTLIVILAIGLPMGFWVIGKVISLVRTR